MDDVNFRILPNSDDLVQFFQSRVSQPLTFLSMQRCRLSGTLPAVAMCVSRTLSLRGNMFSGTLPSATSTDCPNSFPLISLDISFNFIDGYPASMEVFQSIESFVASGNRFTTLPNTSLPSLRVLRVNNNQISIRNLSEQLELNNMLRLEVLDLSGNVLIEGDFPDN
eukprot:PhF_6_TR40811/c4_g3_i3/m.61691